MTIHGYSAAAFPLFDRARFGPASSTRIVQARMGRHGRDGRLSARIASGGACRRRAAIVFAAGRAPDLGFPRGSVRVWDEATSNRAGPGGGGHSPARRLSDSSSSRREAPRRRSSAARPLSDPVAAKPIVPRERTDADIPRSSSRSALRRNYAAEGLTARDPRGARLPRRQFLSGIEHRIDGTAARPEDGRAFRRDRGEIARARTDYTLGCGSAPPSPPGGLADDTLEIVDALQSQPPDSCRSQGATWGRRQGLEMG